MKALRRMLPLQLRPIITVIDTLPTEADNLPFECVFKSVRVTISSRHDHVKSLQIQIRACPVWAEGTRLHVHSLGTNAVIPSLDLSTMIVYCRHFLFVLIIPIILFEDHNRYS